MVSGLAVALFAAGGLGLWRTVGGPEPVDASRIDAQSGRLSGSPFITSGSLEEAIASLQGRLQTVPGDWRSYAGLGLAYVQEARVSADPSFYPKAEGVLRRSLALDRNHNDVALTGMAALALARHDFSGALAWGERARAVNPYDDSVYGVIGDAQVELGRYPQAFRTFQHMVSLKPNLGSYARVSYAQELQGDVAGAVAAMRLAYQAAGNAQDASWASYQLGELAWSSGRVARAAALYRRAVQLDPTFVPPRAGLARVAWASGDLESAIRKYRDVVKQYPLPEYVIALGDVYAVTGRHRAAEREYALVLTEEQLFRANGVNVDLELALFDVDHGRVPAGLRAARAEWGRRRSILVADALAWALYRDGKAREALPYARRALALGTRNALLHFHAGMIERAVGDREAARRDLAAALAINPHFSILYAGVAASALDALRGSS